MGYTITKIVEITRGDSKNKNAVLLKLQNAM
jgi:hypothetical protein